jgi:hypothetical protein
MDIRYSFRYLRRIKYIKQLNFPQPGKGGTMLGPIKAIRNAGDWLADAAGAYAAKSPWPKSWAPEKKARVGGIAATVLGAGLCFAAAEVALGGLLLGGFVGMFGIFAPLGTQLACIGVAAIAPVIFGAGMVKGADRHCGALTGFINAGDRMMDRAANIFRRGRAPSVTSEAEGPYPPLEKPASRFKFAKPAQQFAKAVEAAPVVVQPVVAAPQGPRG